MNNVNVVICNWCTARRTLGAVRNIRKYYPDIHIIIGDDYSNKGEYFGGHYSPNYGERVFDIDNSKLRNIPNTTYFENEWHQGHGLTLDNAVKLAKKELVWFFDSDTRLTEAGQLEKMLEIMKDEKVAVVGQMEGHEGHFPHPMNSLWRRELIEKYHLSMDEGVYYVWEIERWNKVTTCQWAGYQLRRRGYKIQHLAMSFVHLSSFIKELWDKYY